MVIKPDYETHVHTHTHVCVYVHTNTYVDTSKTSIGMELLFREFLSNTKSV